MPKTLQDAFWWPHRGMTAQEHQALRWGLLWATRECRNPSFARTFADWCRWGRRNGITPEWPSGELNGGD
jgi:hypothetical protein